MARERDRVVRQGHSTADKRVGAVPPFEILTLNARLIGVF
jgi:hypothetical protein